MNSAKQHLGMKNQIKKYGPSNVFVLRVRMQEAAEPIHAWLKSKGKTGGQNKIPRLSNNRKIVDEILELIK